MSNMEPGVYKVVNVKGGTAVDLSGADNRSIIGFNVHGQGNQQWEVSEKAEDDTVTIRGVSTGLYLSIEGHPDDGIPIVATSDPQRWRIDNDTHSGNAYRIFFPGTSYNFDLRDHGNPTPGTLIQLWSETPGKGQTWYFEHV